MTLKDCVYLGLIALAALIFYCHGFCSGVNRSRRLYEAMLGEDGKAVDLPPGEFEESDTIAPLSPHRHTAPVFPDRELRGDFGNN